MATWSGVITNAGNRLINEWVNEKSLCFERAAAGEGTVPTVAMMAQTGLVGPKQTASLLEGEKVSDGVRLKLRIAAPDAAYTLNQLGIWASIEEDTPVMIALFQMEQGIPIPGKMESPDFVYTFYALISCSNVGNWSVTIDTSACVTADDVRQAISNKADLVDGKIPAAQLPDMDVGAALMGLDTKAAPADGDGLVLTDSAAKNAPKRLLWSGVKTALGKLFAAVSHQHTKAEISDFPAAMPPNAHTHPKADITDFPASLPASDVYPWAKAATKPGYTWSEIGGKPSVFTPAAHTHPATEISGLGAVNNWAHFVYLEFPESTVWTAPANILNNEITVLLEGGGGGGGGTATSTTQDPYKNAMFAQGGSGGSGHIKIANVKIVPGQSYSFVVGAGGTAGANSIRTESNVYRQIATGGAPGGTTSAFGLSASGGGGGGCGSYDLSVGIAAPFATGGGGGDGAAGGTGGGVVAGNGNCANVTATGGNGGNGSFGGGGAGGEAIVQASLPQAGADRVRITGGKGGDAGPYGGGGGGGGVSYTDLATSGGGTPPTAQIIAGEPGRGGAYGGDGGGGTRVIMRDGYRSWFVDGTPPQDGHPGGFFKIESPNLSISTGGKAHTTLAGMGGGGYGGNSWWKNGSSTVYTRSGAGFGSNSSENSISGAISGGGGGFFSKFATTHRGGGGFGIYGFGGISGSPLYNSNQSKYLLESPTNGSPGVVAIWYNTTGF